MYIIHTAETALHFIVEVGVLVMELIGVIVLLYTGIRCFVKWVQKRHHVRLELAKGIALALGFKMGGEVLRTVIVQDWIELGILGVVVLLRILMTLLIHWEIRNEEESMGKFQDTRGKTSKSSGSVQEIVASTPGAEKYDGADLMDVR